MNLNPLYELKERLESSVIAGVSLLSEDFRLVRAVEQMEPLSKVSPIFEKIFRSAQGLLSDSCTKKGDTLLDILAFVDAVLTTQAVSNVEGVLEPLTLTTGTTYSDAPYSLLAPILEALTTSGSGHYSLIVNTHRQNPEIFSDYRLKAALVAGLNSSYAELADKIEEWLSEEDASILPLLKMNFEPKGKKEMVRRVHIIETVAKEAENAWYLSMLEEAEKDVKAALIYALRHNQENREILISFTETEKSNCKKAAMWALARMKGTENLDFWQVQIKKRPATSAKYLALSTSDGASELIAEAINGVLEKFQKQANDNNFILLDKDIEKLYSLLETIKGKASPKMIDLYHRLASDNLLKNMKTEKGNFISFPFENSDMFYNNYAALSISAYISETLQKSLLWNMDERLFSLAEELYQKYGKIFLQPALTTALLTKPKEEVYHTYSTVLLQEGTLKKEDKIQKLWRLLLMDTFSKILWSEKKQKYQFLLCYYDEFQNKQIVIKRELYEKPDIRWFTLFADPKLKKTGEFHTYQNIYYEDNYYNSYNDWDVIMEHFICSTDEEICKILADYFYQRMLVSKSSSADFRYYPLLKKCGFIGKKGLIVNSVKKGKTMYWMLENILKETPMSLADKIADLEEIKRLVNSGKISIVGFHNERYQMLYTNLVKELEEEHK